MTFNSTASPSTSGRSVHGMTGRLGCSSTPSPRRNSDSYAYTEGSTYSSNDYADPRPKEDDPADGLSVSEDWATSPTPFTDHHQRVQFQNPNLVQPTPQAATAASSNQDQTDYDSD
jgi:hypothetical protein